MFVRPSVVHTCLTLALGATLRGQMPSPTDASLPGPAPLTIDQAVEDAVSANPGLIAARRDRGVAAARPPVERFLMPPMLEGQIFQWPLDTINPADVQFMVTMQQEFPGRGKRQLRVTRAEREAEKADAAVSLRVREVIADVKAAYIDLRVARDLIASYERSLALTDQLIEAAEARYATGQASQQDVVKGLLERTRVEESMLMAGEQAEMAAARLNALRGRDPLSAIGELPAPMEEALPPARVVQDAVTPDHPALRMAAAETQAAAAEQKVATSERQPDYVVQGGYMRMPSETDAWTGRVGFTWPNAPWTRGRAQALEQEAAARRSASEAGERAAASQVAAMVREAYVRAESAGARAELIRTRLMPRTQHVLELAQLGYQADRGDFLDVIDATRASVDLERDSVRARGDRWLAMVALERALGASLGPLVSSQGGRP